MSLLDLLGDWTDQREWVILGSWELCGLCGAKTSMNQGGSRTGVVCNDCAKIDSCTVRPHDPIAERRPDRSFPTTRTQIAHCVHCGWTVDETYWSDEGEWVPYTPDELMDLMAHHARPRHTSHWGETHEIADHDALVRAQTKRRENYWRQHESTDLDHTEGSTT